MDLKNIRIAFVRLESIVLATWNVFTAQFLDLIAYSSTFNQYG